MIEPSEVEALLPQIKNQRSFLHELLRNTLGWPIPPEVGAPEEISYGWTSEELRTALVDHALVDGQAWQLQPLEVGQPWGIFLLEFRNPAVLLSGYGLTGLCDKSFEVWYIQGDETRI